MSPEPFLRVERLEKVFVRKTRGREHLLKTLADINVHASRRDFLTIIGPSGCGKSTLLHCVAGLTPYDAGIITLDGRTIDGPGPDRAVVFQAASLLPWWTVKRNVGYGLALRKLYSKSAIADRVAAVIALVGLKGFENHYPHEISGGMQQRANLARALAVDAKLLLMDEPFGALDHLTKELLQDELSLLMADDKRATLFVTHDIEEAVYLGDRVLVMSARPGHFTAEVTVPFERPRTRAVTQFEDFKAIVAELRTHLRSNGALELEGVAVAEKKAESLARRRR